MIDLGMPYFMPVVHEDNATGVEYIGKVSGILVTRDDGTEVTVRKDGVIETKPQTLTWEELQTIGIGAILLFDGRNHRVNMVFPGHGKLWIECCNDDGTYGFPFEVKYFEVRKRV